MSLDVNRELGLLQKMTVRQLRDKHGEVFGESSRSGHRDFLVRRIIWRMQALDEGDLSERARTRAAEIARDADLRLRPPTTSQAAPAPNLNDGGSKPHQLAPKQPTPAR